MTVAKGLELWRVYAAAALAGTAGQPRLMVRYEDFFADRAGTARRLAGFVGHGAAFESRKGRLRLAETVDERLWRNRSDAR